MRDSLIDRLTQLHGVLLDAEEQIKETRDGLPSGRTNDLLEVTALDLHKRRVEIMDEIVVLSKGDV